MTPLLVTPLAARREILASQRECATAARYRKRKSPLHSKLTRRRRISSRERPIMGKNPWPCTPKGRFSAEVPHTVDFLMDKEDSMCRVQQPSSCFQLKGSY